MNGYDFSKALFFIQTSQDKPEKLKIYKNIETLNSFVFEINVQI